MYDTIIVKEVLNQILNSSNTIVKRCASIENADDFLCNETLTAHYSRSTRKLNGKKLKA